MGIQAVALQGLEQSQSQVDQSARRISGAATSSDSVDLSTETVALLSAKNAFEANLKLAQTADQMERSAINLLA
jgi:flagellar basal body rod protein FlgG